MLGTGLLEGRRIPPLLASRLDYLTSTGMTRDDILLDQQQRTTWENLTYSKELMPKHQAGHRCVIVTYNSHALRATC